MSLSQELLKILACPACKAELLPTQEQWLVCRGCGRKYPIREGVPILLISESSDPKRGQAT
ncbi:Trm112 family protein [Candidatus Acetothermia bacterium]|nr:Trm112 family protein [Candidatus Acetothermia bacterium]